MTDRAANWRDTDPRDPRNDRPRRLTPHASSNRAALEAELLECLDANESDSAATLDARGRRAQEIRRELDAIPNSVAEYERRMTCPDCGKYGDGCNCDATRNRADDLPGLPDDDEEPCCSHCRGTGLSPYSIRDVPCPYCGGRG